MLDCWWYYKFYNKNSHYVTTPDYKITSKAKIVLGIYYSLFHSSMHIILYIRKLVDIFLTKVIIKDACKKKYVPIRSVVLHLVLYDFITYTLF